MYFLKAFRDPEPDEVAAPAKIGAAQPQPTAELTPPAAAPNSPRLLRRKDRLRSDFQKRPYFFSGKLESRSHTLAPRVPAAWLGHRSRGGGICDDDPDELAVWVAGALAIAERKKPPAKEAKAVGYLQRRIGFAFTLRRGDDWPAVKSNSTPNTSAYSA